MLYYYFESKEKLYLAVLEGVYAELGEAESALGSTRAGRPRRSTQLIAFTWNYYLRTPSSSPCSRTRTCSAACISPSR